MKEVLEQAGFTYQGACHVCGGNAELYTKGAIQAKIKTQQMRFILIIGNHSIRGKSADLPATLEKYVK